MDLGKKLRTIRDTKGLTQSQIAEQIGLDTSSYARIEKKGDKLSIEQLKKIAVALGVSIGELLDIEGAGAAVEKPNEDTEGLKKRIGELEELYKASKNELEQIILFYNSLVEYEIFENYIKKEYFEIEFIITESNTKKVLFEGSKRILIEKIIHYLKNDLKIQEGVKDLNNFTEVLDFPPVITDFFNIKAIAALVLKNMNVEDAESIINSISHMNKMCFGDSSNLKIIIKAVFEANVKDINGVDIENYGVDIQYYKNDKIKRKAANVYFYHSRTPSDMVKTAIESGIVDDQIILESHRAAIKLRRERISKDYEVTEDLEVVKIEE